VVHGPGTNIMPSVLLAHPLCRGGPWTEHSLLARGRGAMTRWQSAGNRSQDRTEDAENGRVGVVIKSEA